MPGLKLLLPFFVVLVFLVSCETTGLDTSIRHDAPAGGVSSSVRHPSFTESAVLSLKQGMTSEEIRSQFGAPDRSAVRTCGTETPEPWQCLIWDYDMGKHPRGRYEHLPSTNTFFFAMAFDPPLLNSWRIELMYPDMSIGPDSGQSYARRDEAK